jgi:hypothetical protein
MMTIIILDVAGPLAPAGAIGLIQSPRPGSSQQGQVATGTHLAIYSMTRRIALCTKYWEDIRL